MDETRLLALYRCKKQIIRICQKALGAIQDFKTAAVDFPPFTRER